MYIIRILINKSAFFVIKSSLLIFGDTNVILRTMLKILLLNNRYYNLSSIKNKLKIN